MDILNYFQSAKAADAEPTLLEFSHPTKRTPLNICGINPITTLEVRGGKLYKDQRLVGSALDIFDHLKLEEPSAGFFPAYLGYFSYEFGEYFGKPCVRGMRAFPDAFFRLYEQGLVIDDGRVLHHDAIPSAPALWPTLLFCHQTLRPSLDEGQFFSILKIIKDRIRQGDVYQVNFSLPFYFDATDNHMLAIYRAMRSNNHSPFMGVMQHDDWWLLSGSPERLFSLHNGRISARPIAGTKKRGADSAMDDAQVASLRQCPKENAEHAMLLDLMRNDLNQVATASTVRVDEDRTVELYSHVMHLVSEVSGETTAPLCEIVRALFPGGTITGAPKTSVMTAIADLETSPRGPYTGSLGYISAGFGIDFNIIIRSVFKHKDRAWTNTGAGIVIDSDENSEWGEVHKKAQAIKDILENNAIAKPARAMIRGPSLPPALPEVPLKNVRVLFIENQDSFSFNIVDALKTVGASVHLAANCESSLTDFSHVIIGPGPGNPSDIPALSSMIQRTVDFGLPILGICLGHQAIGHRFGAAIKKIPEPVHGKSHQVFHFGRGLFAGLRSPSTFARYHSLAIDQAPRDFLVDAYTEDDCIMAIRHQTLPIFGVQFHPESYLSRCGQALLRNFLVGATRA